MSLQGVTITLKKGQTMTGNELFDIARKKMPQPDGLSLSELMLFTIARNICKALSDGVIDREQAHREKLNAIKVFEMDRLSERVWTDSARRMVAISQVLGEAEKNGCEHCRRVAKIFDGREIT